MSIATLNSAVKQCCFGGREDPAMHIGRRLKLLMLEKGVSNDRMAAHSGVTRGAVSNWLATGKITRDNLVAAADLLGESVRYLITGDEADRPLSEIEAEFAKREVSTTMREALLAVLRSCPERSSGRRMRPVVAEPAAPAPPAAPAADDELARTYRAARKVPQPKPARGQVRRRG